MLFLKILNRYKLVITLFVITLFLGGYFVTDYFYNNGVARYSYRFSTEEGNLSVLTDEKFFQDTIEKIDENNKLAETDSTYKKISYAKTYIFIIIFLICYRSYHTKHSELPRKKV